MRGRYTRAITLAATATTSSLLGYYVLSKPSYIYSEYFEKVPLSWSPPSRKQQLEKLESESFDLLIIGGGATGVGCAVDAASRGLKTALVERDDFASGTSSRSTKLVHGGVRYLEKAFWDLDYEQYKLVVEALHERGVFLKIAPYLSYQLPILLPVKSWLQVPYYFAGAKAYDILAGKEGLAGSYYLGKSRVLEVFPMLKKDHIVGGIVYYDGAHNDSRMNVALALTAVSQGATLLNHVEVVDLIKTNGKLSGAIVKDHFTGKQFQVNAKGIINATGPFTDGIRKMDDQETKEIVAPSAGVHLILPNYYSPKNMGLVDPKTSDGRVIFFLPWQGSVIAGTTDSPTKVEANPIPSDEDINWILKEIRNYLSPDIRVEKEDVLAAWSGIRPLVRDPSAKNTAALVRNHMVHVSESGLLTIAGGKWTTYRAMAQETIDKAIQVFDLTPTGPCVTEVLKLIGADHWSPTMFIQLIQHFGLETEVAQHLTESYGDRAWTVAGLAHQTGSSWPVFGKRLTPGYPFIEAEVRHACRNEFACTAVDVFARRFRLAFLNASAALEALPRILDIMTEELSWSKERKDEEYQQAYEFLQTMGLSMEKRNHLRILPSEMEKYLLLFKDLDKDTDGYISSKEFNFGLKQLGLQPNIDTKPRIDFQDFISLISEMKSHSNNYYKTTSRDLKVPTDRSGGGV